MKLTSTDRDIPLILVVDDDKFMRLQLRRAMEQAGYQVVEANDGAEGLTAYQNLQPDIVLLDAIMPLMDGFTCCEKLRTLRDQEIATPTPVLMITALDDQESVDRAFDVGANDYITKPIHWAVLRQRVRRMLQESRALEELKQQTEQTRLREEQLRLALDAAQMSSWEWHIPANLTHDFDSYQELLISVHPEDHELVRQALAYAIEQGEDYEAEFRVVNADGGINWVAKKGRVFSSRTGSVVRLTGVEMDITQRKQHEEALRQSEARFRTIVDIAQEGIWLIDINANTTYVNQRMGQMLGYTVAEMLGRSMFDFIDVIERADALDNFARRKQGVNEQHDFRFLRKDGSELWTIISTTALLDQNGQFIGVLGMLTDITERKRSEQKIQEQAALLDIATDAIIVQNLDNTILFWNKSAERLYGWQAEEVLGQKIDNLMETANSSSRQTALKHLLHANEWQGELNQITKNHQKLIVESRWTLVRNAENKPNSILIVNTDITEKKKLESQFLRTQRLESLGTLAGGIAHDLNNVLSPILLAVEVLRSQLQDERSKKLISILETNVKRGSDLVKQVLSFARGIEGERTNIQVGHLITEIQKVAIETFPKSINIRSNIPTNELWIVSGDATQLHQVILNLCVNARDAMSDGGTLTISAQNIMLDKNSTIFNPEAKIGRYLLLTIADTGSGIEPEILDRIFEPFFTTKDIGKGTGLGLSTVVGIIKSHGGFINVYSQVGKGSEFQVYLPAIDTPESKETLENTTPMLKGNGELILVVDDEPGIGEFTKASLELYNYKVVTASDGIEAIALYAQQKQDISAVLVDMMMPNMDGVATIRTLKKMNSQVKIIATSGFVTNDKIVELGHIGVKTFLAKPYNTEQLLTMLHTLLHSNSLY
ncbi:MAG TPA: PAS domain S-box protein [Oculatellaceae cyanobacterium]|jgi:PAS domain S-box-containing protein